MNLILDYITPLNIILLTFVGGILLYFAGFLSKRLQVWGTIAISGIVFMMICFSYNLDMYQSFKLGSYTIEFSLTPFSWLLLVLTSLISFFSLLYSADFMKNMADSGTHYLFISLMSGSIFGILLVSEFLMFFIFLEIITICIYLMLNSSKGQKEFSMKYLLTSFIGTYSMFLFIVYFYSAIGTLSMDAISLHIAQAYNNEILVIMLLLILTIFSKTLLIFFYFMMPNFHIRSDVPLLVIFTAISITIITYLMFILFYVLIGFNRMEGFGLFRDTSVIGYFIAIIGSIISVIATLYALSETNIKKILSFAVVSQMGLVIIALGIGLYYNGDMVSLTAVGGGIYLAFNMLLYIPLLMFCIGAVIYKTRLSDIQYLGGLANRMPITFICFLIGISALIGLPFTSGFLSKWLLFQAIIENKFIFIGIAVFITIIGSFLYGTNLLQGIFLGRIKRIHKNISEVSMPMQMPMITISLMLVMFAIFPGIPLNIISSILGYYQLPRLEMSNMFLVNAVGEYNSYITLVLLMLCILIGYLILIFTPLSHKFQYASSSSNSDDIDESKPYYALPFQKYFSSKQSDEISVKVYGIFVILIIIILSVMVGGLML